ncbi:4'-phosphopantetheinyl transferase superfamily protein [Myxococcota bacterium]|nr:4'-phosphopantetheinyl transferase superfamily protein [Myxococcota bacterium]
MIIPAEELDALRVHLAALTGPGVHTGVLAVEDHLVEALLPEEEALVARAVLKRRREVAAGRVLARRLLTELGAPRAPLMAGPDRAPLWPAGFSGSISHTDDVCVAAVAPVQERASIGVDVEHRRALTPQLESIVLTPREHAMIAAGPGTSAITELPILCFSAKEAVYKAQYPFTRTILEFHDVELELDVEHGRFSARIVRAEVQGMVPARLEGRLAWTRRWVLTAVVWPT